ncbi:GNAT family N-acetyltransferase [Pseudomonas aeruginosa]|nr:GNAT family N-acetyltransferase [Pseudomonas aeruginosa]ELW9768765.1 GNAT family N-acetyltransferase [Pseudomonas aeruginosa]
MQYVIRSVRKSDSPDWLRLRNLLWEADDHEAEIAEFFNGNLVEPIEVLIAHDAAGTAVGHVELSIREDVPGLEGIKTGYIEGMYIEDAHRSTGIAMQLLRASEQWAKDQGCSAFASDREDRVIIHRRFPGNPPSNFLLQRTTLGGR